MIYVSHGTIDSWSSTRISHSLFLSESQAVQHLRSRQEKYVPLANALAGEGDALTVDDATYGALELALIARRYGHAVSWFVNGAHVEHNFPYYPFQISYMLDDTEMRVCRFDGRMWNVESLECRRALRRYVKDCYMQIGRQDEIGLLVEQLARDLQVDPLPVETALSTVNAQDLRRATTEGIELQNHGWSHLNPSGFSEEQYAAEVLKNEEYLALYRQTQTRVFAPPFGKQIEMPFVHADFALLADRSLMRGHRDGNLVNRVDLFLNETAVPKPETAHISANEALAA